MDNVVYLEALASATGSCNETEPPFAVPLREAIDRLRDPNVRLALRSPSAPVCLVEDLVSRVEPTKVVGPALMKRPEAAERLAKELITLGVRQDLLNGHNLNWLTDRQALANWMLAKLLRLDLGDMRAYRQVYELRDDYVHNREPETVTTAELPQELRDANHLIQKGGARVLPSGSRYNWIRLSPSEYKFVRLANELGARLLQASIQALKEGRVITVEHLPTGDRMTAVGDAASTFEKHDSTRRLSFLPTSLIPAAVLHLLRPTKTSKADFDRRRATAFFEALYAWTSENSRTVQKKDGMLAATRILEIAQKSAEDGWRLADIPDWKKVGTKLDAGKLSLNEINDLIGGCVIKFDPPDYWD